MTDVLIALGLGFIIWLAAYGLGTLLLDISRVL